MHYIILQLTIRPRILYLIRCTLAGKRHFSANNQNTGCLPLYLYAHTAYFHTANQVSGNKLKSIEFQTQIQSKIQFSTFLCCKISSSERVFKLIYQAKTLPYCTPFAYEASSNTVVKISIFLSRFCSLTALVGNIAAIGQQHTRQHVAHVTCKYRQPLATFRYARRHTFCICVYICEPGDEEYNEMCKSIYIHIYIYI